ncbi:MAG TPA: SDR family oxidoreductase [Mycobacteriales bacterium]|nr:SDR family oxidoreductase [Mycobacteriales bacterium]
MSRRLSEQVVVVTGASSGIGRTTARMFADSGAVVVATARSEADLQTLVDEIARTGGSALPVPGDVTSSADMHTVAATAVDRFGRLDTWVGGAATSVYGRAWDIPLEEYDEVMRTNWLGQVTGALAALPHLRAAGGTLICIGSVASARALPLQAPYTSSKMALRGFCDTLRMELDAEQAGVAVTLIMPASVGTPFFEHSRSHLEGAPKPLPPVYSPESVAKVIVRAAEHPRRQIVVGGAGFGLLLGQGLAPRVTDRIMSMRKGFLRLQQADEAASATDTLEGPVVGSGTERGGHAGRPSLSAAVTTARPIVKRAVGIGATAAGAVASRLAGRGEDRPEGGPTGREEEPPADAGDERPAG